MKKPLILASLLLAPAVVLAGDPATPATPAAPAAPAEAAAPAAPAAPADTRWTAASLTWTSPFGPGGPEFAYVHGDPKSGPYQAFLRLQTGSIAGWHTHDADYMGVVVQGTHQHLVQGETTAVNLGPGSAWLEKGGMNHDDRCIEGPCILYLVSEGPQTYHPKMADGGDPPPPPPPEPPAPPSKKKKK